MSINQALACVKRGPSVSLREVLRYCENSLLTRTTRDRAYRLRGITIRDDKSCMRVY